MSEQPMSWRLEHASLSAKATAIALGNVVRALMGIWDSVDIYQDRKRGPR